ncbi:Cu(I)/Ag(I) efflux system protein CusF [Pseudomonas sp. OF001]|jgi:Cu(I)/Ag(I) efflux system protein CusF|uniref:copper-binding protein n=1 Tax=unclassified Pseudomonas TaxID=196821 RepID=UPI00191AA4AF|nr:MULTISPECIES: copper-binding protein [unclassified Pseudomonas]WPP46097.1 copper-binding protein [Pseudomonas sp. AN-1]CAD5379132.1 Cu(I)/Ag(I) efflux system protein CusF [Pseudomonas sp. OF001]
MKYALTTTLALAFSQITLAAGSQEMPMGQMPMEHPMKMEQKDGSAPIAKASGTIKAIDTAKGIVTLAHGPVPSLQWPPMTMGFQAKPEQLKGLKVGDKVDFEFRSQNMAAIIVSIQKSK